MMPVVSCTDLHMLILQCTSSAIKYQYRTLKLYKGTGGINCHISSSGKNSEGKIKPKKEMCKLIWAEGNH